MWYIPHAVDVWFLRWHYPNQVLRVEAAFCFLSEYMRTLPCILLWFQYTPNPSRCQTLLNAEPTKSGKTAFSDSGAGYSRQRKKLLAAR